MTWESGLLVASVLNWDQVPHGVIPGGLKAQGGGKALKVEDPTKNTETLASSSFLPMVMWKL